MITLNIVKRETKGKSTTTSKKILLIHSIDQARKLIPPIVSEMALAAKEKREPLTRIDGVSFDTKSEKTLLLELGALISVENT